jgi:hypothetical protein
MTERTPTIHSREMKLNEGKLKDILDRRGMEYIELHDKVKKKYGLDLTYKGFMSLLKNRSTWKLLYAHAIADILLINYMDIFEIVPVDIEKAKKAKEEWKEKYQK